MKKIMLTFLILILFLSFMYGQSSNIDKEITTIAEKLASSYKQDKDIIFKKNIAIADFKNESITAKKNMIGEAINNLLSTKFSHSTIFNLIERKNLDEVLKEQELQLSGLTDSESVVEVGKLLNADVILFGSITEAAGQFNITAKLIDVETGKTISETISIDKKDMIETSEKLDMAYVQKMGVGISINFMGVTAMGDNSTLVPAPAFNETALYRRIGVEVKYRFTKNLMFGGGINMLWGQVYYHPDLSWDLPNVSLYTNGSGPFHIDASGVGFPLNLYFVCNLSRSFSFFISGGVEIALLNFEGNFESEQGGGNGFGINDFGPVEYTETIIQTLRAGFEVFFTPRLAFSFKAGYDFGTASIDLHSMWHLPDLPKSLDISLEGLFLSPSLSFYF